MLLILTASTAVSRSMREDSAPPNTVNIFNVDLLPQINVKSSMSRRYRSFKDILQMGGVLQEDPDDGTCRKLFKLSRAVKLDA